MKYPFDIVSIVRQKTFSVEAKFTVEEEESPLKVFDHFSRYVFAVIANGKAASCNVPIENIEEMKAITDCCKAVYYNKPAVSEENSSPAFTKRFFSGTYKGKSPAEVLKENPNGKEILNTQYKWLKENLDKFPKNKELMEAIVDASKLNIDDISVSASSSAMYTILDIGTRPLIRKTREDGKCFCYECKVIFDSSKNYPVSVMVKNYYAPVKKTDKGLLNVELSAKDKASEINNEFSMTMAEWLDTVKNMSMAKDAFYMTHFMPAYKMANAADKANRESTKTA